jgi:hypothetical protein
MTEKKNILAKIKELFVEQKMASDYTAATNEIIRCLGESLSVGERVAQVIGGVETDLPDGNYLLNNGKSISVVGNMIKEVNEYRAEENLGKTEMGADTASSDQEVVPTEEAMENVLETKLKDGTEIKVFIAGDELGLGDRVEVKDPEGNFMKAPEGRHEVIDGYVIYVDAEGLINEIETAESEKETESEEMKSMFEAIVLLKESLTTLSSTINQMKVENTDLKEKFNKFSAEPSINSVITKQASLSKSADKMDRAKFFGGR